MHHIYTKFSRKGSIEFIAVKPLKVTSVDFKSRHHPLMSQRRFSLIHSALPSFGFKSFDLGRCNKSCNAVLNLGGDKVATDEAISMAIALNRGDNYNKCTIR